MFTLHHIGCLVDDIEEILNHYALILPIKEKPQKTFISTQNVFICCVEIAPQIFLEFIQPCDESSQVYKLRKKGHGVWSN